MQVSVIIPAYNARPYVEATLQSIRAQTRLPDEILLIDDGSSDGTADFVEQHFPEVQVVRQENKGQSAARNLGVELARGDVVAFCDADDVWLPTKLERQIEVLAEHPDVALVYGGWARPGSPLPPIGGGIRLLDFLQVLYGYFIGPSGVIAWKERVQAVGGFRRERLGIEDRDLWSRMALSGPVLMCWDVLWLYRKTPKTRANFRERHWRHSLDLMYDMRPVVTERYGATAWEVVHAAVCLRYRFYFQRDGNRRGVLEAEAELEQLSPVARRRAYWRVFVPYVLARFGKLANRGEDFRHEPLPSLQDFAVQAAASERRHV